MMHKIFLIALIALPIVSTVFAETSTSKPVNGATPYATELEALKAADLEAIRPIAEEMGLTAEELDTRHNILMKTRMSFPLTFMEQLEAEPTYAGSWVEYQPKPLEVHTFAGQEGYRKGKSLIAKLAATYGGFWVNYVEVRKANISQLALHKLRDKVDTVLRTNGFAARTGIGHEDNSPDLHVSVEVLQPVETAEDVLLKAGVLPSPFVKVIKVPAFPQPFSSLYGGHNIFKPTRSVSDCTTGFAVIDSRNIRGVTTAAHCADVGSSRGDGTVNKPLSFKSSSYGGSVDVQWHTTLTASFTITNLLTGEPMVRVTGTFVRSLQRRGDMVCKYGIITNKTCATITNLNDTYPEFPLSDNFPARFNTYVTVTCPPTTPFCANGGDSGAPVYSKFNSTNAVAYGILFGGNIVNNTFSHMATDYLPTAIGVNVLTSP